MKGPVRIQKAEKIEHQKKKKKRLPSKKFKSSFSETSPHGSRVAISQWTDHGFATSGYLTASGLSQADQRIYEAWCRMKLCSLCPVIVRKFMTATPAHSSKHRPLLSSGPTCRARAHMEWLWAREPLGSASCCSRISSPGQSWATESGAAIHVLMSSCQRRCHWAS